MPAINGKVQVVGVQRLDGERDEIKNEAPCSIIRKPNSTYITYDEEFEGVVIPNIITIKDGCISVKKQKTGYHLILKEGMQEEVLLDTPFGRLSLIVRTDSVSIEDDAFSIVIKADYSLFSEDGLISENNLFIKAEITEFN